MPGNKNSGFKNFMHNHTTPCSLLLFFSSVSFKSFGFKTLIHTRHVIFFLNWYSKGSPFTKVKNSNHQVIRLYALITTQQIKKWCLLTILEKIKRYRKKKYNFFFYFLLFFLFPKTVQLHRVVKGFHKSNWSNELKAKEMALFDAQFW